MTDRYAVIGNPIAHSKSPLIHQLFAEQTGQDMRYEAIEAPLDGFAATIRRLRAEGYKGCNVTVPFKFEAYALCDQLSSRAREAKAVNTLIFRDGEILGTNTDGTGLLTDIEKNLGFKLMWKDALLLGAGGAAAGVLWPLFNAGLGWTSPIARWTRRKRWPMSSRDPVLYTPGNTTDLAGRKYDLVINATSSGLKDELPPLPDGLFKSGALAYDMMYGRETPFLTYARKQGAAIVSDGLGHAGGTGGRSLLPVAQYPPGYPTCACKVAQMKKVKGLFWRVLLALFLLLVLYQLWLFAHVCWWVKFNPATSAFMEDRLEVMQDKNPKAGLQYKWVPYDKISDNLKRALIASEDAKFVDHEGFDWEGIAKAYEKNRKKGKIVAGGSTISQQLAKNLFLSTKRTPWRKAEEAVITLMLEAVMDKQRIFEIYLNVIEWGEGVFGAEAAARHYFGVSAAQLSPEQAAKLAAMVPNPRYYDRHREARGMLAKTIVILDRMPDADIP